MQFKLFLTLLVFFISVQLQMLHAQEYIECVEFEQGLCEELQSFCRPDINCAIMSINDPPCDRGWLSASVIPILSPVGPSNPGGTTGWSGYYVGNVQCGFQYDCTCSLQWPGWLPVSKCDMYNSTGPWNWPDWQLTLPCTP
jgi:hypothetical protein